jgi:hypothetical protein
LLSSCAPGYAPAPPVACAACTGSYAPGSKALASFPTEDPLCWSGGGWPAGAFTSAVWRQRRRRQLHLRHRQFTLPRRRRLAPLAPCIGALFANCTLRTAYGSTSSSTVADCVYDATGITALQTSTCSVVARRLAGRIRSPESGAIHGVLLRRRGHVRHLPAGRVVRRHRHGAARAVPEGLLLPRRRGAQLCAPGAYSAAWNATTCAACSAGGVCPPTAPSRPRCAPRAASATPLPPPAPPARPATPAQPRHRRHRPGGMPPPGQPPRQRQHLPALRCRHVRAAPLGHVRRSLLRLHPAGRRWSTHALLAGVLQQRLSGQCSGCPDGTYCPDSGTVLTAVLPCPAGTYCPQSPAGTRAPLGCAPGSYSGWTLPPAAVAFALPYDNTTALQPVATPVGAACSVCPNGYACITAPHTSALPRHARQRDVPPERAAVCLLGDALRPLPAGLLVHAAQLVPTPCASGFQAAPGSQHCVGCRRGTTAPAPHPWSSTPAQSLHGRPAHVLPCARQGPLAQTEQADANCRRQLADAGAVECTACPPGFGCPATNSSAAVAGPRLGLGWGAGFLQQPCRPARTARRRRPSASPAASPAVHCSRASGANTSAVCAPPRQSRCPQPPGTSDPTPCSNGYGTYGATGSTVCLRPTRHPDHRRLALRPARRRRPVPLQ